MLPELSIHSKRVLHNGRNYLVTFGVADFDPDNIMTLDFGSFAVTHKKVKFFTRMTPVSIDIKTGELNFENEDEFFANRHVITPPEVVALLPHSSKGQVFSSMNQLFVPELEENGSELLLKVPEIVIESLLDEISDEGGKFKDLKFKAAITRVYFARTIAQLTRAEIKTVNSMSMNIIAMLKEVDPEAVDEIMRLMQEDAESDNEDSAKADTYINIKISVDHPELADKLGEVRTKQMIKRLSLMMKLPVEFLSDVYDTVPNGGDIIDRIDRELRGVKEAEENKKDKKDKSEDIEDTEKTEGKLSTDVVTGAVVEPVEDDTEEEEPELIEEQTVTVDSVEVDSDEGESEDSDDDIYAAEYDQALADALVEEEEPEEDTEQDEEEESEPVVKTPRKRKQRKPRTTTATAV